MEDTDPKESTIIKNVSAETVEKVEQNNSVKSDNTENSKVISELDKVVTESSSVSQNGSGDSENIKENKQNGNTKGQVDNSDGVSRPLCADYRSDSDSDSVDSESDSTSSTSDTSSSSESEDDDSDDSGTVKNDKKSKSKTNGTDLSLADLPPIEELKISVPEDECTEVGIVTSIVDTLVIVESYKGMAALDVDTVLFLDNGKRTLGRIFDILGPVSEPVYAVRFNSNEQITELKIEKGLKVFYAPKTKHTSFVFLSEIMKIRGSDASWKDNVEAPLEFQDFSDDEEERRCKNKASRNAGEGSNEGSGTSRKRPFPKNNQNRVIQPGRFKAPERFNSQNQRFPNPHNRFRPPPPITSFPPPDASSLAPSLPSFPHNVPPYPGDNYLSYCPPPVCIPPPQMSIPPPPPQHYPPPRPPHLYFTPRFSGPPFPTFGNPGFIPSFQQPFYQQRTHRYNGPGWNSLAKASPPPPPPPPSTSS